MNKKKKSKQKGKIKKIFVRFIVFSMLIVLFFIASFISFKVYKFKDKAKDVFDEIQSESSILGINFFTEKKRAHIKYSEIPELLKNAYVSIEDQRFFNHHGVDIKRTGGAIFNYITKHDSSFGGSTITQQLVKNITGDFSNTPYRKIKEWVFAWILESSYSKEQILECYLNIIYTGPNIYGIQEAAQFYFSKDIKDLSLAECAFIAGITHSPNSYNPFTEENRTEKIIKRTNTVLNKMIELNYISESQYNDAIQETEAGLKFKNGK